MQEKITVFLDIGDHEIRTLFERCLAEYSDFEVIGAGTDMVELLVRETAAGDIGGELDRLRPLLDDPRGVEVFLVSARLTTETLTQAMRAGVREFFPADAPEDDIRMALWRFKERRDKRLAERQGHAGGPGRLGRIINIFGAKGGVGTTTLAVNLASAFLSMKDGAMVSLMDMNLPFGEVQLFLDLHPRYHWGEIIGNIGRLDATYLMSIISRHASGLYLLPPPSRLEDLQMATPENITLLLECMRTLFDTVVVDLGMYLDEITLKVMDISDAILLVGVQNLPCLANVRRFMDNIRSAEGALTDKLKVVVNRHLPDSDLSVEDMEKALGIKVLRRIPNDYKTTLSAINQGKTLLEIAPKAEVTRAIGELARVLIPADEGKKTRRLFGFPFLSSARRQG
ncbi:AAA family ATPase [Desulfolutivibrio sulfoxidireducens]|uniref:AAA family ATPase n=1 Tax=Desulfolutivibrio sulfoxidireducens TaxID=2773299 RepID=UPI00159D59CA|nr:AAA family ATPase [Desulfolutivibrio sulfoxidireducens]QLA20657.1 AAA family ATPase [Desulfolutivibrio sulfoxidireducens]